jgi:hypothetical protein
MLKTGRQGDVPNLGSVREQQQLVLARIKILDNLEKDLQRQMAEGIRRVRRE